MSIFYTKYFQIFEGENRESLLFGIGIGTCYVCSDDDDFKAISIDIIFIKHFNILIRYKTVKKY